MTENPESTAYEFQNVRKAIKAFERSNVQSLFGIGDALILDIGHPGSYSGNTRSKLEKCVIDLEDMGFETWSAAYLDDIRKTAAAFTVDHRKDILETFPHLKFTVFLNCRDDPTIIDDFVTAVEEPDVNPIRLPMNAVMSARKRRNLRCSDVADAKKLIKKQIGTALDDSIPDPPIEIFRVKQYDETEYQAAKDRHPSTKKKYTLSEARALAAQAETPDDDETVEYTLHDPDIVIETTGSEDEGFTYVMHGVELAEPKSLQDLMKLIDSAEHFLKLFGETWPQARITTDEMIEVLEGLDKVRAIWELVYELISGYSPEMH